jgi:hypothetical protein
MLPGTLSTRLDRYWPQSVEPVQDESEHLPGYGYLGQLKDDVSGMAHNPAAHFDELDLEASERPVLEPPGQG